ncbi:hypothetical protein HPP92_004164 [Vanilla planifolia]|uniref:Uncharacterized protein n=1 Tax=Vanilla planifolia TaxID=51239 RepID=A0A835SHR5_VANPL|nr:hypothetical protein HPP92_004600 [Vanilla planifolia]KAG0504092.1 hypothetical protein HPP92_004164 [Vanilla planifolia]
MQSEILSFANESHSKPDQTGKRLSIRFQAGKTRTAIEKGETTPAMADRRGADKEEAKIVRR